MISFKTVPEAAYSFSILAFPLGPMIGILEHRGLALGYSKFRSAVDKSPEISSKTGPAPLCFRCTTSCTHASLAKAFLWRTLRLFSSQLRHTMQRRQQTQASTWCHPAIALRFDWQRPVLNHVISQPGGCTQRDPLPQTRSRVPVPSQVQQRRHERRHMRSNHPILLSRYLCQCWLSTGRACALFSDHHGWPCNLLCWRARQLVPSLPAEVSLLLR